MKDSSLPGSDTARPNDMGRTRLGLISSGEISHEVDIELLDKIYREKHERHLLFISLKAAAGIPLGAPTQDNQTNGIELDQLK